MNRGKVLNFVIVFVLFLSAYFLMDMVFWKEFLVGFLFAAGGLILNRINFGFAVNSEQGEGQ